MRGAAHTEKYVKALPARDAFFVPEDGVYALSHSVGCLPRSSARALETAFLEPWRTRGGEAWPAWLDVIMAFRKALATLLGGSADDYCPQVNLSSALTKILPTLQAPGGRSVIVASEDCFPSLGFVLDRAGSSLAFERRLIPRDQDPTEIDSWGKALQPDVAAVLITHVHSNTGACVPVQQIVELCRQRGIVSIVDIAQSAGVVPVDVSQWNADFVIGSCVKWLCGGPGAGFLRANPRLLQSLEPPDVGWFSHANPFEFDVHSFTYAGDARRFWGGTPSVAPYALATESLRVIAEIGVDAIHRHNKVLARTVLESLPAKWRDCVNVDRIGGTLCIPAGDALVPITSELKRLRVYHDTRANTIRLSLHAYNTAEDARRIAMAWSQS